LEAALNSDHLELIQLVGDSCPLEIRELIHQEERILLIHYALDSYNISLLYNVCAYYPNLNLIWKEFEETKS